MKITRLSTTGFKRITVAEVTIDVNDAGVLAIMGPNESGKSSFLDSLETLIAGRKIPKRTMPVHKGQDRAVIIGEFTDDDGVVLTVRRTYDAAGGTNITVEQGGMRVKSSEAILSRLYSHVALDPLAFANLPSKEQVDTLVRLTGFDPTPIDVDHANTFETRRVENAETKRLAAVLASAPAADPALADADTVDPAKIAADLASLRERNRDRVIASGDAAATEIEISEAEAHLARLRETLADLDAQISDAGPAEDDTALAEALTNAQRTNAAILEQRQRAVLVKQHAESEQKSAALTARLDALVEQKRAGFAAADMPVPGITIENGEVYLDGTPFAETSAGGKLRTSVGIAMAANPDLRAIIVRDGSLLDASNRKIIDDLARANDFTVLMEIVDENAPNGIVFEDGRISRDNTTSA